MMGAIRDALACSPLDFLGHRHALASVVGSCRDPT